MSNRPFKKGFTLVELLVVIAIISLLASILLPSLSGAREWARRIACQSNLHSISVAVGVYSAEYKGAVPLHANNIHLSELGSAPGSPWRAYAAYWSTWADSFNLAILEELGMVDTGEVFYCPSQSPGGSNSLDGSGSGEPPTFAELWALPPEDRRGIFVRTSYMYNPYTNGGERPYKLITDFPTNATMVLDVLFDASTTGHSGDPGWNLLTACGSVRYSIDEWVYEYINANAIGNDWGLFRIALDSLEEN